MKITFLGATGTVTGSKYLIEVGRNRLLVDCGLFQGFKQLRLRNWAPLPVPARAIDVVVLTHAHIDHSGYLPSLIRQGFSGPVYCTSATADLLKILLPDSGRLQEEEAAYANRRGYSKHRPALPLYTEADAMASLDRVKAVDFETEFEPLDGVRLRFSVAGHLLGAASIHLRNSEGSIVFSGDLGRPNDLILKAPESPMPADLLVIESTYGDRRHPSLNPEDELAAAISRTTRRGGVVVVPAFAVGRAQTLLLLIARLKQRQRIPDVPVYLNSPMASDVTTIYGKYRDQHRLSESDCRAMCTAPIYIRSVDDSKALNLKQGPMVIISASGMATGGRVLYSLEAFAADPRNLILLAGFQAGGTRGAALLAGVTQIKIHGRLVDVKAEIQQLSSASAHADGDELVAWMKSLSWRPVTVVVTHGEPGAADALRRRIEQELGWSCKVPDYLETWDPELRRTHHDSDRGGQ